MNLTNARPVENIPVDLDASGELAKAIDGVIVVVGYVLVLSDEGSVQFQSKPAEGDATDLTGPMATSGPPMEGGVIRVSMNEHGWFRTKHGEALHLEVVGSVNVGGHLAVVRIGEPYPEEEEQPE